MSDEFISTYSALWDFVKDPVNNKQSTLTVMKM